MSIIAVDADSWKVNADTILTIRVWVLLLYCDTCLVLTKTHIHQTPDDTIFLQRQTEPATGMGAFHTVSQFHV